MKAVFQNTVLSLLCLATLVLAAPHQSISLFRSFQNMHNHAKNVTNTVQNQEVTGSDRPTPAPSIEDGNVRFACW